MGKMERRVLIPSGASRLAGILHHPPGAGPFPGVVCAHGLESGKESRKFVEIARALEGEMAVLRFDQRGCGESPGDPDDWEGRLGDLRAAVVFLRGQEFVKVGPVGLVGSSFGAYASLRVAALAAGGGKAEGTRPRAPLLEGGIGALVCLASPAKMRGMADGREAASRLKCPALFVHGTRDTVVPPVRSRELWERVPGAKGLQMLSGADHRFSEEDHRRRAVGLSVEWLRTHVRG